jgi:hypothetical protein
MTSVLGHAPLKKLADIALSIPDGKVCLNETGELAVTKFAVEPVSLPSEVSRTLSYDDLGLVSSRSRREIWHW